VNAIQILQVGNTRWRIWLANLSGISDGIDKVIKNFTERWVKDDLLILSGISRSDRVFVTVLTPRFKLEYVYNTETGLYYLYTKSKEIELDKELVPEIVRKEVATKAL